MRGSFFIPRLLVVAAVLAMISSAGTSLAQTTPPKRPVVAQKPAPEAPKTSPKEGDQPFWRLRVSKASPRMLSLKAKGAPLTEIVSELSKKLSVPVLLSPLMQKQRVTLDFENMPLEGAVRLLAPLPYIDYEVGGDLSGQRRLIGVFLYAFNEEPPSRNVNTSGSMEAVLIEGNTEEGTEAYEKQQQKEENPLRVQFEHNRLSVRARKQPLSVVLYEIASKIDIPFDMKYVSTEVVNVNFSSYAIEDAVQAIAPNVRLLVRTNLTNSETIPLRLALVPPMNSQPSTNN